jgi:hypothetical protein
VIGFVNAVNFWGGGGWFWLRFGIFLYKQACVQACGCVCDTQGKVGSASIACCSIFTSWNSW